MEFMKTEKFLNWLCIVIPHILIVIPLTVMAVYIPALQIVCWIGVGLDALWFLFRYTRCRAVPILLCLALATSAQAAPEQEKPEGGGVICGIAVIVVGGIVCYHIVKTCKKAYAKTNAPSEELFLSLSGSGDDYAAADLSFCGYCYEPSDLVPSQHGETLVVGVTREENISLEVVPAEKAMSRIQFSDYLAGHGIQMQPGRQYARAGVPDEPWNVPISFPQDRALVPHVIVGYSGINTVIERSFEPNWPWEAILTNTAPAGIGFQFTDNTTSEKAFYRARKL